MSLAWGGYSNGLIPQSVLVFVGNSDSDHGSEPQYLEAQAARAYFACNSVFVRELGKRLVVNAGNRPLAVQKELYAAYQAHPATNALAAYPGTSNHGWARACDFGSNVQYKGTPEALWMRAHAAEYGFHDTGYGFARVEPWHYDWIPGTATASLAATPITIEQEEESDMKIISVENGTIALIGEYTSAVYTAVWGGQGFSIGVNKKAYGEVTGLTNDEVMTLVNEANGRRATLVAEVVRALPVSNATSVSATDIATALAPLIVPSIVSAVGADTDLTEAQVQAATEAAVRAVFADAATK